MEADNETNAITGREHDQTLQQRQAADNQRKEDAGRANRAQPINILPSRARLDAPHSVVDMRNNDPRQTHVIISRHKSGIELRPGQTVRGVEMLNSELEYFRNQGRRRINYATGRDMPKHPIQLLNVRSPDDEDERLRKEDAEANDRAKRGEAEEAPLHSRIGRPMLKDRKAAEENKKKSGEDDDGDNGDNDREDIERDRRQGRPRSTQDQTQRGTPQVRGNPNNPANQPGPRGQPSRGQGPDDASKQR